MAGIYATLNQTVMALSAHSRAIEITGKNLANVNNPDYARQRVLYGDRGTVMTPQGAESLGLEALGVQQIRDALLDQQVTRLERNWIFRGGGSGRSLLDFLGCRVSAYTS